MPQIGITIREYQRLELPTPQIESTQIAPCRDAYADDKHRLGNQRGFFEQLCQSLFISCIRRPKGNGLGELEKLPPDVREQILGYINDPFDRAKLLPTCKAMRQFMARYNGEFALFRSLIRTKESLDWDRKSGFARGLDVCLNIVSGFHWADANRRRALKDVFKRLVAMYPHVPARIFHEAFPLFQALRLPQSRVSAFKQTARMVLKRSPHLAVMVLTEFAWRCEFRRTPELDDQLFDHAVSLWRNPATSAAAERLIGCIVMRYDFDLRHEDQARWRRALALLPSTATVASESVLGLAAYAQRWEKGYREKGSLTDALFERVGFPLPEAIEAFEDSFSQARAIEARIDADRYRRFEESPLYQRMRERRDAPREPITISPMMGL